MSLKLIPYVILNGNAREAIGFYEKALGGQVLFSQSFGDMPASPDYPLPPEAKERIAHATMQIGDSQLMFSDTFPGQPHQIGTHVTICITTDDKDQARRAYDALKDGGEIKMPLQETFWSPAYGIVVDKFGVTFQISCEAKA